MYYDTRIVINVFVLFDGDIGCYEKFVQRLSNCFMLGERRRYETGMLTHVT
jgi:hypothetical protein